MITRILITVVFVAAHSIGVGADHPVEFNRHIRPILTKNCTTCHGGVMKAGGVSFLYREDVLGKGESGLPVVVPGHPEKSEMIARIISSDDVVRMPPPEHHPDPLTAGEIEILTRWIKQGAEWQEHWAFQAPQNPPLPEVSDPAWPATPLDHFILARLDSENLAPATEAPPAEWLRRTTLDLTGLPPTLEEYETFQSAIATDPQAAREAVADRLLASPHFGERWASVWLDLARYSDTFGFEKDPHRDIWPFRDWVVDAFNADMPYDDFTLRQLAGDLLENPDPRDLIATAFHRNTQNNTEGGTDDEEYRMEAVIDRTNTTWTAWNGMTFGCVQCHDHPYDPIPHHEFYEFLAFFNNSEDVDLNSDFPRTKVADDSSLQGEIVALERHIRASREEINDDALTTARSLRGWSPFTITEAIAIPATGRLVQDQAGDFRSSGTTPNKTIFQLRGPASAIGAIKLDILPLNDDPAHWDERGAVVTGFEVGFITADGERRNVPIREVIADFLAGPFDPNESLKKGNSGFGEYPMMKSPRTAWFVPESPAVPAPGDTLEIVISHGATCNENQNTVLRRFRIETTDDDALATRLADPARAEAWKNHDTMAARHRQIPGMTIPVMQERSEAATRETRVFIRGNRTTLDAPVKPGIPALFGGPDEAKTRLDMARWITSEANPTSARVLANRLWAEMFGTGIVDTLGDFGSSGSLPSHPELLDHLAIRLRDHHQWHLKPFLREIVISSTYRQSNRATAESSGRDPRNRMLARGPRQRLTAEMVRDHALALSGLFEPKLGGPPVFPPQPDGIWSSVYSGAEWKTADGPDRYRRTIYTYHKRTAGHPGLLTFDAPDRSLCTEQRFPTNTPLQALVTLNDPAHIEFAAAFAERMMDAAPDDLHAQIAHGYRMITLRAPEPETVGIIADLFHDALIEYRAAPEEAEALAPDDSPERAALILVANTLLNSDHALNR